MARARVNDSFVSTRAAAISDVVLNISRSSSADLRERQNAQCRMYSVLIPSLGIILLRPDGETALDEIFR